MAIGLNVFETLVVCKNCIPNFKILSKSILKLSLFFYINLSLVLLHWFYSLAQAVSVTSQAENSNLLKRVLIE